MDRIKGFDGLRALAIAAVFLQHYTSFGAGLEMGSYGVWLFFALSGFLIIRILHRERLKVEAGARTVGEAMRRFFWRRTLRIMPIYYLVLAVFTVLSLAHVVRDFPLSTAWWHYGYLSNIYFGEVVGRWVGRFGYFWSLAIEEQFYLLAAPALLLAPSGWFRNACGAVVMVAFVQHLLLRLEGVDPIVVYTNSIVNFGVLAFGGWLALALPARPGDGDRSWPALLALGAVVVLCWAFSKIGAYPKGTADLIGGLPLIATTVLAAGALALIYLNQASLVVRALEWRPLAWLGKISYGLYLYHNLPPHWLLTYFARRFGSDWAPSQTTEAAFSFLLTLALAVASWFLIERPLMRLKDRPPRIEPPRLGFERPAPAQA